MILTDRVAVVTGAGHGIGAALACRLATAGVRGLVVSDIDGTAAEAVAASIVAGGGSAIAVPADASVKSELRDLVRTAEKTYGGLDIFCSNAGRAFGTGIQAADSQWTKCWELNVLQHVYAAQAAVPGMLRRGLGYLLITASAAGLLSAPGDAPYSTTKHAAVGLAEWLAITYRPRGIRVSALCPLGVRTNLLMPGIAAGHPAAMSIAAAGPLLRPEDVAEATIRGLNTEDFLILPHQSVASDYAIKAADPDRWIDQMAQHAKSATGPTTREREKA
jgi:NAD(P)-dependent dehydrogenase (short-subunit alcohol dehydrogenase family)